LQSLEKRSNGELCLYGVELSKKYINQAKRLLNNVQIFEMPLEEIDFALLEFDVIVLRHVLEHLGNPMDCLKKIRSIIAPQGVLYIEVPDSRNTDLSISNFYHHEHLLYFTSEILNSYLRAVGFKPLLCERFDANPIGSGFSYPVIRAVSSAGQPSSLENFQGHAKRVYLENMTRNKAHLESLLAPVCHRLQELIAKNNSVGLFGAGPHTMDLLELLDVENIPWSKIFDNNPSKQGKSMRGIPIVKPDNDSLNSVDCVLISSAEFEREILAQLRSMTVSETEIITIYQNYAS